jgi:hypothetical protein
MRSFRIRYLSSRSGQSVTETVLLLPIYLLLVFGLLQSGQLAASLIVAEYAASAIARQAVQDGISSGGSAYEARFERLLLPGMKSPVITVEADNGGLLSNVTVYACARVDAFPFLGQLMTKALGQRYSGGGSCDGSSSSVGPFYFNGAAPYFFRVKGQASARQNYRP